MNKTEHIIVRIKIVFCLFALMLSALVYRLYHVQITRHQELLVKAKGKYTKFTSSQGERGEIYDYFGNLLVGNIPCTDISADPQMVGDTEECRKIAAYFSNALNLSYETIFKRLCRKKTASGRKIKYAVIAKNVDYLKASKIRKQMKKVQFKGIYFRQKTKRYYPKNKMLANILGFTNIDRDKVIAVIGIEKFFHSKISPTVARSKFERARDGSPLSYGHREIQHVKDGLNIFLTIQEPIQAILEEELDKLVEKWSPKSAYAIMADPFTGNIIAIAQRPTFNPNNRKTMKNPGNWRNRIIEDVFEPGSTMKPIAVAGALDFGIVTPLTKFDCENGIWYYAGKPLRDAHAFDILTVTEIIQKSSNIGTAKIALSMGEKRLYSILRRFGLGQKTGIPLRPESRGIFRKLSKWDKLSITRFPIGQGLATSPLQLVRAYCALANGGKMVDLRIVDRIQNPDTGVCLNNPIKTGKNIYLKKDTHSKIIDMMKLVTKEGGTATKAGVQGYEVAGKTGTSQKWITGSGYSHSKYFASFIGFVPADNPAFVLLVTADEPEKCHYGGTVSAPTFKNIALRTLRFMNVQPEFDQHLNIAGNNE